PFGDTLGFRVERVGPGEALVLMLSNQRHHNLFGYIHGGAIYALADTAIGVAHLGSLGKNQTATTVESKISFLRPAFQGMLQAQAMTIKRGRTLSYLECDIYDEQKRLVARANGTMMTLEDDRSEGRRDLCEPRDIGSP